MRIPDIQARLRALATEHNILELSSLADALKRRPQVRGAFTAKKVTPEIRERVKKLAMTTTLSQQKIGELVGINGGRVSEILHGKRT